MGGLFFGLGGCPFLTAIILDSLSFVLKTVGYRGISTSYQPYGWNKEGYRRHDHE